MTDPIVSTRLRVHGVRDDGDVRRALQALFDVFAEQDLGQATFEVDGSGDADLWIKHKESVAVDPEALNQVLAGAGSYRIIGGA